MDPHTEAHLFVGAIRVLHHQKKNSPAIEDLCTLLDISVELGNTVCRRLEKAGIIEIIEDPFANRLAIADYVKIEELPRQQEERDSLAREVEQFMAKKQDMDKKVQDIQAEHEAMATDRETLEIGLEKTDVRVSEAKLVWVPVA